MMRLILSSNRLQRTAGAWFRALMALGAANARRPVKHRREFFTPRFADLERPGALRAVRVEEAQPSVDGREAGREARA